LFAYNPSLIRLYEEEALSDSIIQSFREKGHILIRGLVQQAEIDYIRPFVHDLVKTESYADNVRMKNFKKDGRKESRLVENMRNKSQAVREFTLARRFARMAADLLGVDSVRVLADHAFYKEPGDRNTAWNQDCNYVAVNTDQIISIWLPLIDLNEGQGALSFISGSHTLNDRAQGDLRNLNTAIRKKMPTVDYGTLYTGDATFHAGWTFHSAAENTSNLTREVIRIMYVAGDARIMDESEIGTKYAQGIFEKYFVDMQPGDHLLDPMYPLVYRRAPGEVSS